MKTGIFFILVNKRYLVLEEFSYETIIHLRLYS